MSRHRRSLALGVAGATLGMGLSVGSARLFPTNVEHRLHEEQLRDYCQLFTTNGDLWGGAGGALSWRCIDHTDSKFQWVTGLYNLDKYCRERHGQGMRAVITDIASPEGWVCTTQARANREHTIAIEVDEHNPAVGARLRDQGVIPIVDTPNRYLDPNGPMDVRHHDTLHAFCIEPLFKDGGPPYMYGVITPNLQRGYVRSDFTEHPYRALALPRCQTPAKPTTTQPSARPSTLPTTVPTARPTTEGSPS